MALTLSVLSGPIFLGFVFAAIFEFDHGDSIYAASSLALAVILAVGIAWANIADLPGPRWAIVWGTIVVASLMCAWRYFKWQSMFPASGGYPWALDTAPAGLLLILTILRDRPRLSWK